MDLYIKHMVSTRCKLVVKEELDKLGLQHSEVDFGRVVVMDPITTAQYEELKTALMQLGLELIENKKDRLVERIKNVIIEMVHYSDQLYQTKNSDYISKQLNYDYTYLANLFSETTGNTIEHFIIAHKVERVKELILQNELNLTQISYKLSYSSVAHLSTQFKKVTGVTPTNFKKSRSERQTNFANV